MRSTKQYLEAREKLEKELFGKEKNTMKTYFRADEFKEVTGNKEILARELMQKNRVPHTTFRADEMREVTGCGKIVARELKQKNRVLHTTFNTMNCNSEKINVKNATKIAIGDRVYAIVGYHCGEILAVKIGEEIVDGFANLYMIKNRVFFCEANLAWMNYFQVEKIGIIEAY